MKVPLKGRIGCRGFGHDIDDSAHSTGSIKNRIGTPVDLDAIDVAKTQERSARSNPSFGRDLHSIHKKKHTMFGESSDSRNHGVSAFPDRSNSRNLVNRLSNIRSAQLGQDTTRKDCPVGGQGNVDDGICFCCHGDFFLDGHQYPAFRCQTDHDHLHCLPTRDYLYTLCNIIGMREQEKSLLSIKFFKGKSPV